MNARVFLEDLRVPCKTFSVTGCYASQMGKELVSDELWEAIEPLLPPEPPKPKGARPRVPDRAALTGIVFVLKSGIPWEMLPQEMGCGSGSTCWHLLATPARLGGVRSVGKAAPGAPGPARGGRRDRLGAGLLRLGERAGQKGGEKTAKNPTDRGKPGSKRHIVSDRKGVPLAVVLTAADVHDSNVFEELMDTIEPIERPKGRPRKRPAKLHADKGYAMPRSVPPGPEEAGHQEPHSEEGQREQRAAGAAPVVGGRAHAGVAGPLSQAGGALRAASGHPRSAPSPWLFPHLPQLPNVRVLQGTLSTPWRIRYSPIGASFEPHLVNS